MQLYKEIIDILRELVRDVTKELAQEHRAA
jgi:hypothetical protein